ncbi:MAG: hypothetical protein CVT83_03235 [Alphaproteobacteria bacterium HGW-Alphaproteobacteria-5]|nr:MAG: hypothetical protein CVT83_03235 [Alphaproteobacteria bacterium HGW-Alphaproteobacteria-5]
MFASTLGKTPEYFQGKSFWDIYPKEHADHRFAASSIVFETGQPGSVEVVVPLPDRTLYYLAKTNPVRDPEGNVIMNLTHAVDITENKLAEKERRNLEAQLLQAQKLESLGVLAGGIAHDFNNILMAILGFAELAQQGLPPAAPGQSDLAEIIKASKRAAELVRQMLAYAGQTRLAKERLDLAGVVDEVARMIEMAVSKRADLVISSTKVPPINADASQMSQIVMNLVLNAAEAGSSRRNRITVWTGVRHYDRAALDMAVIGQELPAGQYVTLEVSDDGDGMDGETASRVFEPFFTTKFTGRGLGLAAVHGIVRSHQGAILLRSGPGQGTTFTILFPIADPLTVPAEEKAHPTMTPAPATPSARGSGTLLLIDDEETARTVGRRMLENLGYEVLTASSGAEGINAYRSHEKQIRAVVLDYLMPHMDGAIVLDEIRSANPEAKIVLSTGQGEDEVCDRFKNAGLSGVIHKPYSMEQLASTLASVLR